MMKSAVLRGLVLAGLAIYASALAVQTDWNSLTSVDGSLSISMPQSWVIAGNTNDPKFKENWEKIRRDNPKMAQSMSERPSEKYILHVFDTGSVQPGSMLIDNMNIAKAPANGFTEKHYGELVKEIAKGLPLKGKLNNKTINLPVGRTLTYWGTIAMKLPDGTESDLDLLGVVFVTKENLYIATFMCKGGELPKRRETWDKIAKSFRTS